jgi:hypothetical protein
MNTEERTLRARTNERYLDIEEICEQIDFTLDTGSSSSLDDQIELLNLWRKYKVLLEDNLKDLIRLNDIVMIIETETEIARAIRVIEGGTVQ